MHATLEIRMSASKAETLLPPGVWKDPGTDVCRLVLDVEGPLVEKLRAAEAEYAAQGSSLFSMCQVTRHYTPQELESAERLLVEFWPFFRPTGEECNTVYDESTAHPCCGVGARQDSPLRLELSRIPKRRDLTLTMGGEYVITRRMADALQRHHITGYELHPITSKGGNPTEDWFQLVIPSRSLEAVPPTLFGASFLAPEPDSSRCPYGHVAGHRLLSPLYLARSSTDGNDWACTRQHLGLRMGLFRPYPLLVVSQRLYRLLRDLKLRPLHAEVAHLT